jgi:hypothetical protein
MWELLITPSAQSPTIKGDFSVFYSFDGVGGRKLYKYYFDINEYQVCRSWRFGSRLTAVVADAVRVGSRRGAHQRQRVLP